MKDLQKILKTIHGEVLNLRNIEHMITQRSFQTLWLASKKKEREFVSKAINEHDKEAIIKWVRNHPAIDLGEKSLTALKEVGRKFNIVNYSRLHKAELLREIMRKKEAPVEEKESPDNFKMLEEIFKLVTEMSPLFLEAKIQEDYLSFPEESLRFDSSIISEAYKWINKIYSKEYKNVLGIWTLLSPDMWQRYRLWEDFGDHRETTLLNEALQKLRRAVINKNRPDLFKKYKLKVFINQLKKGDKNEQRQTNCSMGTKTPGTGKESSKSK